MKLIEVVVLMGAHCVSPVQHTGNATEAAKVQCAVVIEKDTQAGTLRIVPAGASREPEVVAVLNRLDNTAPTEIIEPASAPPVSTAAAPPASKASSPTIAPPPVPLAAPVPAGAGEQASTPAGTELKKPEQQPKAAPREAAAKQVPGTEQAEQATKSKCLGEAKPKWYTNAEGRRKYRCVLPG